MFEGVDFAEYLAEEARSADAAIHQFMESNYRYDSVHLFVEGDDDGAHYIEQIRQKLGYIAHHYICGGKGEVIRAFEDLSPQLSSERVVFIVDRDLQDFLGKNAAKEGMVVTDFYSFESDYIDEDYISNFLAANLNLSPRSVLHRTVVERFRDAELTFARGMRSVMAYICAVQEGNGRLNLNNLNLDRSFSVDSSGNFNRVRSFTSKARDSITIDDAGVKLADVRRWYRRLTVSSRLNWLRGKYYLWALFRFLKRVAEAVVSARNEVGKRKGRMPASIANFETFKDALRPFKCSSLLCELAA